jgi:hypothetical protein
MGVQITLELLSTILLVMRKNTYTDINIKENILDRGLFLRAMYTVIVFLNIH